MAYPGEKQHVKYLEYVEKIATGELQGPQLPKEEWQKLKDKPQEGIRLDEIKAPVINENQRPKGSGKFTRPEIGKGYRKLK